MSNQEIFLHPLTWDIIDKGSDEGAIQVRCWAFDRHDQPVLVRIEDFPASCFVELPLVIDNERIDWSLPEVEDFVRSLVRKLPDEPPLDWEFSRLPHLYYYDQRKYPMVHLTFKSLEGLAKCVRSLAYPFYFKNKGKAKVSVWENKIPYLRKLLTRINLGTAQWFSITKPPLDQHSKISRLDQEYLVSWKDIKALDNSLTRGWDVSPKYFVFDIEAYSKNHKAFPDKHNTTDVAYMISVITQIGDKKETRKRQVILYGECFDIPGVEVIRVDNEIEGIHRFSQLIIEHNPDIISGYNHHGFDNDYLNSRLERVMEDWRNMGRLLEEKAKIETTSWFSNAYGQTEISILKMSGRISIDMLPVIKRDYKLHKYDLDTVGKYFLERGKHPIKPEQIFKAYENYMNAKKGTDQERLTKSIDEMTSIVRYCVEDSEITLDIAIKVHVWIASVELSNIVGVTIMDLYTRGQQIRCLSKIYDEAHRQGYVVDFKEALNVIFNGGAVEKPEPGITDEAPFYDVNSMYPSIIISGNICYTTYVPDHLAHTVKDQDCNIFEFDQLERPKKAADKVNEEDFNAEEDVDEGVLVHRKLRFVKPHIRQGVVPKIVKYLVDERKKVKGEIKQLENKKKKGEAIDELLLIVLDRRQNGLKITGNSFFGFFGAMIGRLPLIEAAMAITAEGRRIAAELKKYLKDTYNARIVYGDTDSVVPKFPNLERKSWEDKYKFWKQVEEELSSMFPGIILEMEKITRIINFAPKMYAYLKYSRDGQLSSSPKDLEAKGIILARRDGTPWVRNRYREILFNILKDYDPTPEKQIASMEKSFNIIIDTAIELLENKVPWQELAKINEASAKEKSPIAPLLNHLKEIGRPTQTGDRLQYLVCNFPDQKTIGKRLRTVEEYIESQETNNPLKIDANYYLENALLKKIDPLWQVAYGSIINKMENIGYKPNSRKHFVGISDPVKLIARTIEDGLDIRALKTWFKEETEVDRKKKVVVKRKASDKIVLL